MALKDAIALATLLAGLCCMWRVDYLGSAQNLKYYLDHGDTTSEYYLLLNRLKPWVGRVNS